MASYPLEEPSADAFGHNNPAAGADDLPEFRGGKISPDKVPTRTTSRSAPTDSEAGGKNDGRVSYVMQKLKSALPPLREMPRKENATSAGNKGLDKSLPALPVESVTVEERTEDTTVHTKQAPAVTHETIYQNLHEHEHQRITREIHEHHVYHRILPIHDIEVLPPVHYVSDDNGVREVSAAEIPGRHNDKTQKILEEGFKKALPRDNTAPGRRQFSARQFVGTEGDYSETTTADGVKRSETWWVHPPTTATGAKDTGQTRPLLLPPSAQTPPRR